MSAAGAMAVRMPRTFTHAHICTHAFTPAHICTHACARGRPPPPPAAVSTLPSPPPPLRRGAALATETPYVYDERAQTLTHGTDARLRLKVFDEVKVALLVEEHAHHRRELVFKLVDPPVHTVDAAGAEGGGGGASGGGAGAGKKRRAPGGGGRGGGAGDPRAAKRGR